MYAICPNSVAPRLRFNLDVAVFNYGLINILTHLNTKYFESLCDFKGIWWLEHAPSLAHWRSSRLRIEKRRRDAGRKWVFLCAVCLKQTMIVHDQSIWGISLNCLLMPKCLVTQAVEISNTPDKLALLASAIWNIYLNCLLIPKYTQFPFFFSVTRSLTHC